MENKQKTYIFIGRSGCGKGTQIDLVSKKLKEVTPEIGINYISTGQDLRKFWEGDSYTHKLSKEIVEKGDLQPEFLVTYLWGKDLVEDMNGNEHLILDGTPRRLNEAEVLDSAVRFYRRENPTVIYVNVSREWAKDKLLKRGRHDDTDEGIDERLDWFDRDVVPAIDYLKNNPTYNFVDINGEQTIEEVFAEIEEKIQL
ncbi:nucleoside monophosphate kinase [Patescibacteria group bacterium]|nr:nucleoside monophosphate kinase [Patescibacteria group bacterium]